MKIIQSTYIYDETLSMIKNRVKCNNINMFYSSLLSYITLKHYYGDVKFFTNPLGYERIFKYIPYDELELIELPSKILKTNINALWFYAKIIALKNTKGPLIHVDNDVMIFKSVFDNFINDRNIDILAQELESIEQWSGYKVVFDKLGTKLKEKLENVYQGKDPINCGVLGFKSDNIKNEFVKEVDDLIDFFIKNNYFNEKLYTTHYQTLYPMVIEQCNLKEFTLNNNYSVKLILNNMNSELKQQEANNLKYTHLWSKHKYDPYIINMIKRKIKREFPKYYKYVEIFEEKNEHYLGNTLD